LLCNNGPYTVSLPAAAANVNRVYRIKNIDAQGDVITIDGNSSETIDGALTYALQPYKHSITIISDGANWHIIDDLFIAVGSIATINCAGTDNGTLTSGTAATGVTSVITYTGGNAGTHSGQTVTSTGVTGLTATLSAGTFTSSTGNLTYTIAGTPASSGTASFAINIGGQTCSLTRAVSASIPGNATCTGATISATSCASVSGATINDNGTTTLGTEYNWTGATTSGMANTSTTQALVEIGGQCWMRYNMNVTPTAFNPVPTWANNTDVGWSGVYTGGPFTNEGLLYQWRAAMNNSATERAQGVCATGWHIPSDCEWMYLENSLGMTTADQQVSGATRTSGDVDYDLSSAVPSGTNNSGFSGLTAGAAGADGAYYCRTSCAYYWSSSKTGSNRYRRAYNTVSRGVFRDTDVNVGLSVRCLKD